MEQYRGTTILSVRRGNRIALGGDGQVTLGNIVIKASARKVRTLYNGNILAPSIPLRLSPGPSSSAIPVWACWPSWSRAQASMVLALPLRGLGQRRLGKRFAF